MKRHFLILSFAATNFIWMLSCSKSTPANMPLIKPPVMAATPDGLMDRRIAHIHRALDVDEIKSRFYSDGPTNIENLLDSIDSRISEINTRSDEDEHTCLAASPVEHDFDVFGEAVTAYFQCYDLFGDGTGGMIFGKKDDVWYLYTNVGQGRTLATVRLVSGTSDKYHVEAWMSVGQANGDDVDCSSDWYGCSYGVIHLKANSATSDLEMSVAGTGFGYCGAHLKSEGTNLFVKGSDGSGTSDGSSWTCNATDSACTLASDTTQAGSCGDIGEADFELNTLGVTGESNYGTGITLDGDSTDDVHFGLTVAQLSTISGVGAF